MDNLYCVVYNKSCTMNKLTVPVWNIIYCVLCFKIPLNELASKYAVSQQFSTCGPQTPAWLSAGKGNFFIL